MKKAVFILMGQSNATGHGILMDPEDRIEQPLKNVFGLHRQPNQSFDSTRLVWSGYTSAGMNLAELFIVSAVDWADPEEGALSSAGSNFGGVTIGVSEARGERCPRCWMHSESANAEGLCPRCADVVSKLDIEI